MAFKIFHIFLFSLLVSLAAHAQQSPPEKVIEADASEVYLHALTSNASVFKGKAYEAYTFYIQGTPFFQSDEWLTGSVFYDSTLYSGLSVKMELVKDAPVIFYQGLVFPILLSPEKISWFKAGGHHFVRLVKTNGKNTVPETGFYDLLYKGSMSVWVKREKELKSEIHERQVRYWFNEKNTCYIEKNGSFERIRSQGKLLRVLSEKRKEVKAYLKKNNWSVRKDPELAILKAVRFFDQKEE
ncbi:MAG: hypothetical protein RLP14_03260 [Owenweeksia sp.]